MAGWLRFDKTNSLGYEESINDKDGSKLILIPAGEFIMGSEEYDTEKPRRTVYLDAYLIDKYEVTVAQYRKFCNEKGRKMPFNPPWGAKDDHPMVNVTWDDAVAYCKWAGKRLPTEAEWEKAARGTDGREFPWGNYWDPNKCSNSVGKSANATNPVGSFPSGISPYGCLDIAGNVWEWCQDFAVGDWYNRAPSRNPKCDEKSSMRIIRGGSWQSFSKDSFRCTTRDAGDPGN